MGLAPHSDFRAWNEVMVRKYHPTRYHRSPNPLIRWIEGKRTRTILSMLDMHEEECVLDVGCGAGDILERIPCGVLAGLDISPTLVAEAKVRLGSRAEVVCGDAESADGLFPGRAFDKVYCSEVLEHVLHPHRVVQAMAALTRPGGRIVVSVPNERLINAVKRILRWTGLFRLLFGGHIADRMEDEWHIHIFSRRELLLLLCSPPLVFERIRGIPFSCFPLRYVVAIRRTE